MSRHIGEGVALVVSGVEGGLGRDDDGGTFTDHCADPLETTAVAPPTSASVVVRPDREGT
jgi:hypothetical protein